MASVLGQSPIYIRICACSSVRIEQRTSNPRVGGSIPSRRASAAFKIASLCDGACSAVVAHRVVAPVVVGSNPSTHPITGTADASAIIPGD